MIATTADYVCHWLSDHRYKTSRYSALGKLRRSRDIVLFNNKDILVDGKPVYINEWFKKGVVSIKDLLKNDGNFLTFKEFSDKYGCQTNFLQYYQIISAIPNRLLTKAKDTATCNKLYLTSNNKIFNLNDTTN